MADIYSDTFKGAAAAFSGHIADLGGGYSAPAGYSNGFGRLSLDGSNHLILSSNTTTAATAASAAAMQADTGYAECGFTFDSGNAVSTLVGFVQDLTTTNAPQLTVGIQRTVQGVWYMTAGGTLFYNSYTVPAAYKAGQQNVLRLELRGGTLYYYLNGTQQYTKTVATKLSNWHPMIQLDNNQGVLTTAVQMTYAKAGNFLSPPFWTAFVQSYEVDA